MSDFKNKIHYLIKEQLPEYVASQYPLFVTFLEKYYEFLESSSQANELLLNSPTWNDIDKTLDVFIPAFRKQFAGDFPINTQVATRRLIKYIHDFYEAKGSENATEIFFRVMYDTEASVFYPNTEILRASDGKWVQKQVIKLKAPSTVNPYDLEGKKININFIEYVPPPATAPDQGGYFLRSITVPCERILKQNIGENIYQLVVSIPSTVLFPDYIKKPANDNIGLTTLFTETASNFDRVNSFIYVIYGNKNYGFLTQQIISVNNIEGGANFQIGDTFTIIDTDVKQEALVGVSKLDTGTGIKRLDIITSGQLFSSRSQDYPTEGVPPKTQTSITATLIPYSERFLDEGDQHPATITFNTGIVQQLKGAFKNSSGFLSDVNALHDSYYYQPFSYVIQSSKSLELWKDVYTKTAHPAGLQMFAECKIREEDETVFEQPVTEVTISDAMQYHYVLAEIGVTPEDSITREYNANVSAAGYFDITYTDDIANPYADMGDIVSPLDSASLSSGDISTSFTTDSISTSETITINTNYNRSISDSVTMSDSLSSTIYSNSYALTDSATISDSISFVWNRVLQVTDLVSVADTDPPNINKTKK